MSSLGCGGWRGLGCVLRVNVQVMEPLTLVPAPIDADVPVDDVERRPAGSRVVVRFRKFDGTPHWTHYGFLLGSDEFGVWVGCPEDVELIKPGSKYVWPSWWVMCFPRDRGFVLTANPRPLPKVSTHTYVDVTSVPSWHQTCQGLEVRMVDYDLDIIRRFSGEVKLIDQEDFARHQVSMKYPKELISECLAGSRRVLTEVESEVSPFDETSRAWVDHWGGLAEEFRGVAPRIAD